jgi:hypothetical protein
MKIHIFLVFVCVCFVGCSKEPTKTQLELVDRLIQEQIDIPYKEPNFEDVEDMLLKYGETAEEAKERNKKLYTDTHEYLVALKNKPYKDKKAWAVNNLESSIDLFEKNINSLEIPLDMSDEGNKEVFLLFEQRKEWLAILKE